MDYTQQQLAGLRAYAQSMEQLVESVAEAEAEDGETGYMFEQTNAMLHRSNKIYAGEISPNYSELAYLGIWLKYALLTSKKKEQRIYWGAGGVFLSFLFLTQEQVSVVFGYIALTILFASFVLMVFRKSIPYTKLENQREIDIQRINAIYETPTEPEPQSGKVVTFNVPPQDS